MGELINGRTPEKIRFNIMECAHGHCLSECPYDSSDECVEDLLDDALALIERLEAERDAALAKVPKWISVEERLPDGDQGLVLVRANGVVRQCQGLRGAYELAEYIPDVDDVPGSWEMWDYHRGEIENLEILSWAPLPTEEDSHDA